MKALTKEDKLLSTVGLCARARKLVMGTPMVCETLRIGKPAVHAVLEASDTSANTHKRLADKCAYYQVPLYRLSADTVRLGRAVGKTGAVAAVGVTDKDLYRALSPHLPQQEELRAGSPEENEQKTDK